MDSDHAQNAKEQFFPKETPCEIFHIQSAGHQLMIDNPADFNAVVSDIILNQTPMKAMENKTPEEVKATQSELAKVTDNLMEEQVISYKSIDGEKMAADSQIRIVKDDHRKP